MTLVRKEKGILGIDPGLTGGFVILGPDQKVLFKEVVPLIESAKAGSKKQKDGTVRKTRKVIRQLDMVELNRVFKALKDQTTHCFMESVASRPGMSAPAVFKFGQIYGSLEALLVAWRIPYTLVTPQKWGKSIHAGVGAALEPKEKSRVALGRLFPEEDLRESERSKKPHEGLMDALLIAEWGRRFQESEQFE